jgi:hypothetical protein
VATGDLTAGQQPGDRFTRENLVVTLHIKDFPNAL